MSADLLRRAAAQMREEAALAESEWADYMALAESSLEPFAPHVQAWSPRVAFAVAEWLEGVAHRSDELRASGVISDKVRLVTEENGATVARAYLGADS